MIEYRKATIDDIEELLKVRMAVLYEVEHIFTAEQEAALLAPNREYILNGLADGSFAEWLAVEDNKIIGTSSVSFYLLPPTTTRPNGKTAYIGNMFTYPEYRGRGIGSQLLSLATEEAKLAGCNELRLNATDAGRPIYQKFGFKCNDNAMIYYIN